MAKSSNEIPNFFTAALLIFIVVFPSSLAAAARPLRDNGVLFDAAAVSNLLLPGGASEYQPVSVQVIKCEMDTSGAKFVKTEDFQLPKRSTFAAGEKYKTLFMSMKPKGKVIPPSGPSRRSNSINN